MITAKKVLSTAAKVAGTIVVGGVGLVAKTAEEGLANLVNDHGNQMSDEQIEKASIMHNESSSISDMCFNCVKGFWAGDKESISNSVADFLSQHTPDKEDEEN